MILRLYVPDENEDGEDNTEFVAKNLPVGTKVVIEWNGLWLPAERVPDETL